MNTTQSDSIANICSALLKAQQAIGSAKKESENPFYHSKYADLGSVMEACKKALNDNGICVLQPVMGRTVQTVLLHESGEWIQSETPIVCAVENDPQKLGSAISYARRYGLQSMVFIPAEDDDAETAKPQGAVKKTYTYTTGAKIARCQYCGATGKFHKPNCPNALKVE